MPQSDEFLNGGELAEALDGDGMHGLLPAEGRNVFREAMSLVEQDERVFLHDFGGDFFTRGQWMAGRDHEQEFLVEERLDLEVTRRLPAARGSRGRFHHGCSA